MTAAKLITLHCRARPSHKAAEANGNELEALREVGVLRVKRDIVRSTQSSWEI